MNYNDLQNFIEKTRGWKFPTTEQNQRDEIYQTYKTIFGKPYNITCNDCYMDCLAVLNQITREKMQAMTDLVYRLISGTTSLYDMNIGMDSNTTNANLTNEKAEWFLIQNPANSIKFERMPGDWMERITNKKCGAFPTIESIEPVIETVEEITETPKKKNKKS